MCSLTETVTFLGLESPRRGKSAHHLAGAVTLGELGAKHGGLGAESFEHRLSAVAGPGQTLDVMGR